ncbi:hypothetical protein J4Q44_G00391720, partial [Coregonus suidteri]
MRAREHTGSSAPVQIHSEGGCDFLSVAHGLVLLFHQLFVPEERSILNVLLLPRNVVIREVQDERKRRNGDKEPSLKQLLTASNPNKPYILSTQILRMDRIKPT